jgi:signal transduction histidine kinase
MPDGVRVIADDYSVVAVNAEFCRQAGLTREQALARPCFASSHGRAQPCIPTMVLCPLMELRGAGARMKASHIHVDGAHGGHFAAEVAAALLQEPPAAGGRKLVVESIRDLSQNAQVSQQQRLSEIGGLAAGVAHEIHNPLASIRLGLAAIDRSLADADVPEAAREFMGVVNVEVDRCLAITDRMLRLSRIPEESGDLVDIGALARDAFALLRYEAEARGVVMELEVPPEARVIAAEGDLGMILVNLIQNALHAMPQNPPQNTVDDGADANVRTGTAGKRGEGRGLVRIGARVTADRDVIIEISDTGVGIPPEHLSKIFHPFWSWRADGSSGSGLGLAICQSLALKWRGEISAVSEHGRGSTFSLRFPHADKALEQNEREQEEGAAAL